MITDLTTAVSLIAPIIQTIVIVLGLPLLIYQLWLTRKSTDAQVNALKAQSLIFALEYLQNEKAREGRKILNSYKSQGRKDLSEFSEDDKNKIEVVCNAFDIVGIMENNKILPPGIIVKEYRDSIITAWETAKPLIDSKRTHRRADYWDDFEQLYKDAKGQ